MTKPFIHTHWFGSPIMCPWYYGGSAPELNYPSPPSKDSHWDGGGELAQVPPHPNGSVNGACVYKTYSIINTRSMCPFLHITPHGHPILLVWEKDVGDFVLVYTSWFIHMCVSEHREPFCCFPSEQTWTPDPESQSDEIIPQQLSHWWKMEICTEAISSLLGKLKGGE